MEFIICTLFENHYHHGVAALANSLYQQGFEGNFYAGYRGELPKWAAESRPNPSSFWQEARLMNVGENILLHLIPLKTDYHLTNYKPDFMLDILKSKQNNVGGIFYFDPDIIVASPWKLFITWIKCGVALCEDVNSPLSENHPRRLAWREFFNTKGVELKFKDSIYVNGGFVGVSNSHFTFLNKWKSIQEVMGEFIGGLGRSSISGNKLSEEEQSPFSPFGRTDQDALNATVEAYDNKVSMLGQEAMAFKHGPYMLPHALGHNKPWEYKPLTKMINGISPRLIDREYWNHSYHPVQVHSKNLVRFRKISINIALFVGRFYRKK